MAKVPSPPLLSFLKYPSVSTVRFFTTVLALATPVSCLPQIRGGGFAFGPKDAQGRKGNLGFNCVEVSEHCQCYSMPASSWGKPTRAIEMEFRCHHMCPMCAKAVEHSKLPAAVVKKDAEIYETDCAQMNHFCQCQGGTSGDSLKRDHCKLSCEVCEYADRNYKEVHIHKKATDNSGIVHASTAGMLAAIKQREMDLCKHRTEFGPWSGCTKSCGGGLRYRYRDTVLCWQYKDHESERPHLKKSAFEQHQQCNNDPCPDGSPATVADLSHPSLSHPTGSR